MGDGDREYAGDEGETRGNAASVSRGKSGEKRGVQSIPLGREKEQKCGRRGWGVCLWLVGGGLWVGFSTNGSDEK